MNTIINIKKQYYIYINIYITFLNDDAQRDGVVHCKSVDVNFNLRSKQRLQMRALCIHSRQTTANCTHYIDIYIYIYGERERGHRRRCR